MLSRRALGSAVPETNCLRVGELASPLSFTCGSLGLLCDLELRPSFGGLHGQDPLLLAGLGDLLALAVERSDIALVRHVEPAQGFQLTFQLADLFDVQVQL